MPIYVYRAKDKQNSCRHCKGEFEVLEKLSNKPLARCPQCKAPLNKVFGTFSQGPSKTDLDKKAKAKGFHKLKKVAKGKYEKLY